MANYNVTLNIGIGKGSFATFSATNGDGLAYNDPLDVNGGDTITFIRGSGGGAAKFRDLSIFTNNANFDIASGGANVVRTVASGGVTLDSITGKNGGETHTDYFFLERQAAASDTTPNAFDFTNQPGVTRSSTRTSANTVTIAGMDSGVSTAVTVSGGTYSKNGGSYTSASTTASNGTTFKLRHTSSSSYSTNTTTTLTVGGVSGSFVSTTEAAPAIPSYTLTAPTSINEGSSGTINIATTNVTTGTSLYWSVTSSAQFTGSTSDTVTTNSSGAASFSVTPVADTTTEGALTVTARIRTGSQGGTIVAFDTFVINDTSTTPGGGSTGGQTGGSGSNDYGIEIYGPDNSTVVFGSDLRCTNIYVYDKRTYAANSTHSYTGITNATDSSKVEVILSSGFGTSSANYSFARTSANGGTITVSNGAGQRQIETVVLTIG